MVEIEEIDNSAGGVRQRAAGGGPTAKGEDLTDGSGNVIKEVTQQGEGPVCGSNKAVKVHYTGRFLDGRVFDSSVTRGRPLEFVVGTRSVILGWDVGIASMKKGEKAKLTIKPDYAYGSSGAGGVIPPNSTLVFEVELIDFGENSGHGGMQSMLFMFLSLAFLYYVYFIRAQDKADGSGSGTQSKL